MNILFLSPSIPDSFSRIRALNMLKVLSRRHSIHLLSFIENESELNKAAAIEEFCSSIETVRLPKWQSYLNCTVNLLTFSGLPFRVSYFKSGKMHRKVKEALKEESIDLVFAKRKRMAQYAESLHVKKVLDLTDCIAMLYERSLSIIPKRSYPLHWAEAKRLAAYEPRITEKFDRVFVCSPADKDYLEMLAGKKLENVAVVPNVVDLDYYKPKSLKEEQNSILFSGIMHAFVNIDAAQFFAEAIMPLVLEEVPDAKFYIVGPQPPRSVRKFASENIVVAGKVPSLKDYIEKASVIVVPLRCGAGTRNKILQASALGKAIVSTSLGAEGLEGLENGKNILIADSPQEFAEKVVRVLGDSSQRASLGKNAKSLIEKKYSLQALDKALGKALAF